MSTRKQQSKTTLYGGLTILLAMIMASLAWSQIASALSRRFLSF